MWVDLTVTNGRGNKNPKMVHLEEEEKIQTYYEFIEVILCDCKLEQHLIN